MDNIYYSYRKTRKRFGRHVEFDRSDPEVLIDLKPNVDKREEFLVKNPRSVEIDAVPLMSEHYATTESIRLKSQGMQHLEGGWPKDVDVTEVESKRRYIKKLEQGDKYAKSVRGIAELMEGFIKRNNALDVYEEYFVEDFDMGLLRSDLPRATTAAVFKDPSAAATGCKRTVSHISWAPRDGSKLATAYCNLRFQRTPENYPVDAYIWDVENPNEPHVTLTASSPLLCIEFNPLEAHILAAGCYSGVVALFDTRKSKAVHTDIKVSHKDPIYDLKWIRSKNDVRFMTCSTDGRVMIWDMRALKEPLELYSLNLTTERGDASKYLGTLGAVAFDYNQSYGPKKFMTGTERGIVASCSTRSKTKSIQIERPYYAHHGPVVAVERNPFNTKFFMSVGDWTTKIWMDDLRRPIISTKYLPAYLTDGAWSPSRPGVFFTARSDGVLDIWDIMYKRNLPALSVKLADVPLTALRAGTSGKFIAVGDENGDTHMIDLSDSLSGFVNGEKRRATTEREQVNAILEAEAKRVTNLQDMRKERLNRKKQATASKDARSQASSDSAPDMSEVEREFNRESGLE